MNLLELELRNFGAKLSNRLDQCWIEIALDYVDHGEIKLAYRFLIDYIVEYDIPLSSAEFEEIGRLAAGFQIFLDQRDVAYLKGLTQC